MLPKAILKEQGWLSKMNSGSLKKLAALGRTLRLTNRSINYFIDRKVKRPLCQASIKKQNLKKSTVEQIVTKNRSKRNFVMKNAETRPASLTLEWGK